MHVFHSNYKLYPVPNFNKVVEISKKEIIDLLSW